MSSNKQPPSTPNLPNLNSPPGASIPNAPPSSANTAPLSSSNTTASEPASTLTTATANTPDAQTQQYRKVIYYSSMGVTVAAPIIAIMPPRKFDLYTFGLGIAWCMSTGFVLEERTGRGLLWHVGSMIPSAGNQARREREKEEREENERMETLRREAKAKGMSLMEMVKEDRRRGDVGGRLKKQGLVESVQERETERKKEETGLLTKVWMGSEGEDWIEDRAKKEKETLDEGRGYSGLIGDYVRDAFGYKDVEDGEEAGDDTNVGKK